MSFSLKRTANVFTGVFHMHIYIPFCFRALWAKPHLKTNLEVSYTRKCSNCLKKQWLNEYALMSMGNISFESSHTKTGTIHILLAELESDRLYIKQRQRLHHSQNGPHILPVVSRTSILFQFYKAIKVWLIVKSVWFSCLSAYLDIRNGTSKH